MQKLANDQGDPIAARGVFSRCPYCGAEFSASAGDYWNMPKDEALTCNGAGSHPTTEMVLATSERIIHYVGE